MYKKYKKNYTKNTKYTFVNMLSITILFFLAEETHGTKGEGADDGFFSSFIVGWCHMTEAFHALSVRC